DRDVEVELERNTALVRDWRPSSSPQAKSDNDPTESLCASDAPFQRLGEEARMLAAGEGGDAVDLVGGSPARPGFLPGGCDDCARALGLPVETVHRAIAAIRIAGGPAIAAADVRESLLLQLEQLERDGDADVDPLARLIVDAHLERLAAGRLGPIA